MKSRSDSIWAALLEKAWAKVSGGYDRIPHGLPNEALSALTGVPSKTIIFYGQKPEYIWELINRYTSEDSLMCASTSFIKKGEGSGLVGPHAYTLIGTTTLENKASKDEIRLVMLRNPWGQHEWNGNWSDTDKDLWTEEYLNQAKYMPNKDD